MMHRLRTISAALVIACVVAVTATACTTGPVTPAASLSTGVPAQTGPAASAPTQSLPSKSPTAPPTTVPRAGHSTGRLKVGDLTRTYRLYVPAKAAQADATVPLLVALHGGGGSGAHFESDAGFDALADSAGFVVAYPDAVRPPGGQVATWDAGNCCGYAARTGIDDVGFVRTLITSLRAKYPIDERRIYVDGFSNGGMLAYRVACQLAGTVAAVGAQSATLEYAPCQPSRPVSLIHIHGTADTNVPLAGGPGSGRANADYTPPQQAAATIAAADGCARSPVVSADPSSPGAQRHTWPQCPTGVAVQFITWPGATHSGTMRDSSPTVWSFLAAHPSPAR